ncbi:genetic competence negative regulator [Cytobacillus sp. FJAT-53684]|uniref:Adapter protein MecA n=1 Tax=Cytobacillus mangrovibacter TaxID=3299024 RepID=A0ABW6JXX4_9BACI
MRLERLNYNKIKIFLTLDDLSERGLTKEDIWKDSMKWHQLFHEMLEEASDEFGVEIQGSVAVEIFSMQTQGMIMIVTMEEQESEDSFQDGFIEMQVIMEGEDILFELDEFEYAIQLAKRLSSIKMTAGSLYAYEDHYYFHFCNHDPAELNKLIAILAEYGNPSMKSIHILQEYGKEIIKDEAIETLVKYFH